MGIDTNKGLWDAANQAAVDPDGIVTVGSGMVDGVEYLEIYKGTDYETPVFDESKHYLISMYQFPVLSTGFVSASSSELACSRLSYL